MGLFGRQQQCEKTLEDACQAVGAAAGKVAVGEMPADFLTAVIEGSRQRLALSFAEVKELKGERKALKLACDTASVWAGAPLEARNRSSRQARREAEELIRRLCVGLA